MSDVHTAILEDHTWDGRTNDRGVAIIKFCEGWPKGGKPYICPAGYWTTGYGSLRGLNGKRVNKNSPPLTKEQGEELLRRDLAMTEKAVHWLVGPRLNANQFSATVSLVFNIGSGNFRASQIRQRLLRDDHDGAADIWWQWRRGGPNRRILPGLVKRREMERELFETD
jgi:lysozyme